MGIRDLISRLADFARASPGEVALVAVAGAAVVAGSLFAVSRTSEPPAPPLEKVTPASAEEEASAEMVVVHVAGLVTAPGVYELPAGSRVKDALDAAGGPAEGADLDALNLAAVLSDGQKVYVPRVGEAASGPADAGDPQGKVNLNSATQAQLESLPGIGPVLAERILAYRQRKGGFTSVRQLLEVEGIGPKKYESLKDLVTV